VLDRVGGGVVRTKIGIEVSQNSNANGVGHAGIVLDAIAGAWGIAGVQVRRMVRGGQHLAISTQQSALSTQHSALS
jgi:hypothetical protein